VVGLGGRGVDRGDLTGMEADQVGDLAAGAQDEVLGVTADLDRGQRGAGLEPDGGDEPSRQVAAHEGVLGVRAEHHESG